MVCTLLAGVNVVAFAADDDLSDTVSVQKFYYDVDKGGNGEHIYTIDEDEISWYKSLPSWNDEGEAWKAPLFSEVPVYRVANYNTGEHLWITDKGYVDYLVGIGWTQEQGVAFYSDENEGVPVYRLWDGTGRVGSHHYSTDAGEIAWLVSIGWQNEGPQFYGVKGEEPATKALSAAQVGSDKIMVSSEDGFTGEESFTVSHGDLVDELAGAEYDEDLDVYTITLANPIEDATYTVSCDGYTPANFEGEVSEKVMFATQTGADEITVTSEVPFEEGVEFEVSHGLVDDTVIDYVFDDDRCTVQLYLEDDIVDAKYTVECSDEEYDAVEFDCKAAVLTTVNIDDKLICIDPTNGRYTLQVETVDQFDDPYFVANWDAQLFSSPTATGNWNGETGIMTVTNTGAAIGAKESIILSAEGVVAQGEAEYKIGSIPTLVSISDTIQMTEAEAERNQTGRIDVDDLSAGTNGYYVEVTVMDQYGNLMTDSDVLNDMVTGDYLIVSGNGTVDPVNAAQPFSDDDMGTVYMLVKNTSGNPGVGMINILPVTNPTGAAKGEYTVSANEAIATLTVAKASDNLRIGSAIPVAVTATNNYGETVDINTEIAGVDGNNSKNLSFTYMGGSANSVAVAGGAFTLVGGNMSYTFATKTTPAVFAINAEAPSVNVFATTASGMEQFAFTAEAAAKPAGIYALSPLLVDTVAYGTAGNAVPTGVTSSAIILKDQYGEMMTETHCTYAGFASGINAKAVSGSCVYTIAKKGTLAATTPSAVNGIVYIAQDGAKSVKDTYTLTAWQVGDTDIAQNGTISTANATKLGTIDFTVTVAAKAYASYSAELAEDVTLYTVATTANSGSANQIQLYGTTADGVTVPIAFGGNFTAGFRGTGATAPVGTNGVLTLNNGAITVTTADAADPGTTNGVALIDVYANGELVDTVSLTYSNNAPETMMIVCMDKNQDFYDIEQGLTMTSSTQGAITAKLGKGGFITIDVDAETDNNAGIASPDYTIYVVDQYGLTSQATLSATFNGTLVQNDPGKTKAFGQSGTLVIVSGTITKMVPITVPTV